MGEDDYVAAIDRVEAAATELRVAVDVALDALVAARLERVAGVDMLEIVRGLVARGGKTLRLAPNDAFRQFEHAITMARAVGVRTLVDDVGMNFTEIGHLTGVSRQMVARLYRTVDDS
jgi:hypothetical protein